MKNSILFLLIASITFVASCSKKTSNTNPANSCIGEPSADCISCEWNVLNGKTNGNDWCSQYCEGDFLDSCDPARCRFYPDNNFLHVSGGGGNFTSISFYSEIELGINKISLSTDLYYLGTNADSCKFYAPDSTFNNLVEIFEINIEEKIIEGSFQFRALNICQDTVEITDGYFKLTYD